MSKTAREIIGEHLKGTCDEFGKPEGAEYEWAEAILAEIDAAGFVIMERPKGDGLAIPDYVPPDATPEQMRAVIQSVGGLLMREGYEANNYLDLTRALFDLIVDFQKAKR